MPNTPDPDIDGLHDRLNEARLKAHGEAAPPPVEQLTAFAAIAALITLTEQIHHLTLATREHTAQLERT